MPFLSRSVYEGDCHLMKQPWLYVSMIVPGKILSLSAKMSEEFNIPFGIRSIFVTHNAMPAKKKTRRMAGTNVNNRDEHVQVAGGR